MSRPTGEVSGGAPCGLCPGPPPPSYWTGSRQRAAASAAAAAAAHIFLQGPPAPGSLYRRGQVLARAWCPTPRPQCSGRVRGVESGPKIRGPVRLFYIFGSCCHPWARRGPLQDRTHDPWAPSPCLRRDPISATELSRVDRCGGRGWTGLGRLSQLPSWPGGPSNTGSGSRLCILRV